jgi:hypothetical protein
MQTQLKCKADQFQKKYNKYYDWFLLVKGIMFEYMLLIRGYWTLEKRNNCNCLDNYCEMQSLNKLFAWNSVKMNQWVLCTVVL